MYAGLVQSCPDISGNPATCQNMSACDQVFPYSVLALTVLPNPARLSNPGGFGNENVQEMIWRLIDFSN